MMRVNQRNLHIPRPKRRSFLNVCGFALLGFTLAALGIPPGLLSGVLVSDLVRYGSPVDYICWLSGIVGTPIMVIAFTIRCTWLRGALIFALAALWAVSVGVSFVASMGF